MTSALGQLSELYERRNGADSAAKSKPREQKLSLPDLPFDTPGRRLWLTRVFNLDPRCPITSVERQGAQGPGGHVVLRRGAEPEIRVEPASRLNSPLKLIETLTWFKLPSDGVLPKFESEHCRQISHVVATLCSAHGAITAAEEAMGIIGDYLLIAERVTGYTTHGTAPQRYEAAAALWGGRDAPRYLVDPGPVDVATGEVGPEQLVMPVLPLQETARRHMGSSLERGWMDGRMTEAGFVRATLDGHARPGNKGPHLRVHIYRGVLPSPTPDDQPDSAPTSETQGT